MTVYGVFKGNIHEGSFLVQLYHNYGDARLQAIAEVEAEQSAVNDMKEFVKCEGLPDDYNDFREVETDRWAGSMEDMEQVEIWQLEVK